MGRAAAPAGTGAAGGCAPGFGGESCLDYAAVVHTASELLYALRSVAAATLRLSIPAAAALSCAGARLVAAGEPWLTAAVPMENPYCS